MYIVSLPPGPAGHSNGARRAKVQPVSVWGPSRNPQVLEVEDWPIPDWWSDTAWMYDRLDRFASSSTKRVETTLLRGNQCYHFSVTICQPRKLLVVAPGNAALQVLPRLTVSEWTWLSLDENSACAVIRVWCKEQSRSVGLMTALRRLCDLFDGGTHARGLRILATMQPSSNHSPARLSSNCSHSCRPRTAAVGNLHDFMM